MEELNLFGKLLIEACYDRAFLDFYNLHGNDLEAFKSSINPENYEDLKVIILKDLKVLIPDIIDSLCGFQNLEELPYLCIGYLDENEKFVNFYNVSENFIAEPDVWVPLHSKIDIHNLLLIS